MAERPRPWTVNPHGPLVRADDNLWIVHGDMPSKAIPLQRTMSVLRLADGRLVIHSAIALDEHSQKELEALGPPSFLIVPSGYHRLDAHAYRVRYPNLIVLCPEKAAGRVRKLVAVDGDYSRFPADPTVAIETLEGIAYGEGVVLVHSGAARERLTLIFNDVLFNQADLPGLFGGLFKVLGSTGGPRVTPIMKRFAVSDREALRAHLRNLANRAGLKRIVPGHGELITENAADVLRAVAAGI